MQLPDGKMLVQHIKQLVINDHLDGAVAAKLLATKRRIWSALDTFGADLITRAAWRLGFQDLIHRGLNTREPVDHEDRIKKLPAAGRQHPTDHPTPRFGACGPDRMR